MYIQYAQWQPLTSQQIIIQNVTITFSHKWAAGAQCQGQQHIPQHTLHVHLRIKSEGKRLYKLLVNVHTAHSTEF